MFKFLNKLEDFIFLYLVKKYWEVSSHKYRKYLKKDLRLFFGITPIINIKYWSKILQNLNFYSKTVVETKNFNINKKTDFDLYLSDILDYYKKKYIPKRYISKYYSIFLFDYSIKRFNIFHLTFKGFGIYQKFGIDECQILKLFGSKTIIIPYGADFLQYNKINNYSFRHGLMTHYPQSINSEENINKNVRYWAKNADVIIGSNILEGKYKWDLIPFVNLSLDISNWKTKNNYNNNNGENGVVIIAHCPNHRKIKGTEFIINAINNLKKENLKIELLLFEGVKNDVIIEQFSSNVDILVEQLFAGYGLNGVEGLASGIPVLSNLINNDRNLMYRRFSYLNECPVISTSVEALTNDLRILIKNPKLREKIGKSGRLYVEKYHSEKFAKFMFSSIYDKIFYNKNIDLLNLFNPLNPESYNNSIPLIKHDLINNKLPNINIEN